MFSKKIIFVAGESVPFCKTGGLADVIGTLPASLKKEGVDVSVFLPFYKKVKESSFRFQKVIDLNVKGYKTSVVKTNLKGVDFYFIKQDLFYNRDELYATSRGEYPDNALRFSFFGLATLKALKKLNLKPDILHLHDWHTGTIPVWIKKNWLDGFFKKTKILITIHNLAYQGWYPLSRKKELLFPNKNLQDLIYKEQFNFLYWGLKFSDSISTVSPTYSKEIMKEEFGCELHWLLKERRHDLKGILNGIDYGEWSPENDKFIPCNYDKNLKGKEKCKKHLLNEHSLKYKSKIPVFGAIGRLADQKGWDIISESIEKMLEKEVYFIILGTGEEKYHKLFRNIAKRFPGKTGINIKFDNAFAHRIYAGSDFFLMPSRFEPCGLGQLISFKYGTVPIVNPVGGLKDTVNKNNGILLDAYSKKSFLNAIDRAISLFKNRKRFIPFREKIISLDFSWKKQARKYVQFYKEMINH